MTQKEYCEIESYMLEQMRDSAHDMHHVYRVLNSAADIAGFETGIDYDVLLAACILHDIGRQKQFENPQICHAQVGGEMALEFLLQKGWGEAQAAHVRDCIASHRYRKSRPPQTTEAKILFDADKLDACGALGIARTLIYKGQVGEPLYSLDTEGEILLESREDEQSSFFQEYNYKLKNVYERFFTARAAAIAKERQKTAADFYSGIYGEVKKNHELGKENLAKLLK